MIKCEEVCLFEEAFKRNLNDVEKKDNIPVKLETNFAPNTSKEVQDAKLPHGRKGIGRLTFFSFAQMARWETVYEKDGKRYQYYIDMNKDSLNEYDDNGGNEPVETSNSVGTKVTFTQLVIKSDDRFNASNVKWTYFLVGNRYNKNGYIQDEIDGHRALGEPHLVHADRNGNNKIYVLT